MAMTFGAALLDALPQVAVLAAAAMLLSLATIKVCARWRKRR